MAIIQKKGGGGLGPFEKEEENPSCISHLDCMAFFFILFLF